MIIVNIQICMSPPPTDLASFMKQVEEFAQGPYAHAKVKYPKVDQATVQFLSEILGIPPEVLMYWKLDPTIPNAIGNPIYLSSLLQDKGKAVGLYDGRVKADET